MKKVMALGVFIVLAVSLLSSLGVSSTFAATYTCDGSQSDCQAKITASSDGDIITIPSGTYTWASGVSWTNKNITVAGAGKDVTIINAEGVSNVFKITITDYTKASWSIGNFTMQGTAPGSYLVYIEAYNATRWSYGWRLHHIKFNYTNARVSGASDPFAIYGVTWGLIDHCDFWFGYPTGTGGNTLWQIAAFQSPEEPYGGDINKIGGAYNFSLPLDLGTEKAIYFEDNTFKSTNYTGCFDWDGGGARVVFRHNDVSGAFLYGHWTRGSHVNWAKFEVYNNKFDGAGITTIMGRFEGGTGVVYNNTIIGLTDGIWIDDRRCPSGGQSGAPLLVCDGTHAWDGKKECSDGTNPPCTGSATLTGWPCLGQIGRSSGKTWAQITRGDQPVSVPAYFWNNGAQNGCRTGGTCTNSLKVSVLSCGTFIKTIAHSNAEVDYVNRNTAMPGYTPYTYPHPLNTGRGGGKGRI